MPDNPHIPLPCGGCGFRDAQFVLICLPFSVFPVRYANTSGSFAQAGENNSLILEAQHGDKNSCRQTEYFCGKRCLNIVS